ncbi:nose resistant to fluoxetine protein 6-like [Frankliniella occidentalis]|uniref:Nose resistant to fluoxetine protein 6-like n=1 Tax=Frankliniella occidentalis TaxID=133901 RepID=A0A9C6X4E1_FRAOC|nr:nose resistant to fluoxetine protein 6-like [Frankliniella occidentalis]
MRVLALALVLLAAAGPQHGVAAGASASAPASAPASVTASAALSRLRLDATRMLDVLDQLQGAQCRNHTRQLLDAAANLTAWASLMMDATAKTGSDLLRGNEYVLGGFDECLSVPVSPVPPQYCLAEVRVSSVSVDAGGRPTTPALPTRTGVSTPPTTPPASAPATTTTPQPPGQQRQQQQQTTTSDTTKANTFQPLWPNRNQVGGRYWTLAAPEQRVRWGACLPAACGPHDLAVLLRAALRLDPAAGLDPGAPEALAGLRLDVTVPPRTCQDSAAKPFQGAELVVIGVFIGFLSLLVIATVYDVFLASESDLETKAILPQVLVSFSVRSNLEKLVRWSPSELGLDCVLGIKFYCMLLITAGHGVVFLATGPITNADFVQQAVREPQHSYLLNGMLLVDSFLVVSGFLLTRLLLLELDKRGSVNFGLLYIFRYIRLTPSYLAVVALYATLLPRLGSGPLWPSRILLEQDRCRASWWTNLLYVNNYVNTDQLCMFQSWYISADTQLFMLAPLVVYPLWRWPTLGRLLAVLATFLSILIPFAITWSRHLDPVLLIFPREIWQGDLSGNAMYQTAIVRTHMRASSYSCGLLLGWFVHRFQSTEREVSQRTVRLGWAAAVLVGVSCMFSVSVFYQAGHAYNPLEAALYASLHRLGWCVATSWVIFACVTGNGGVMQRALTWRPLVPLSRLTYCAYLVNGAVVLWGVASVRQPRTLSTPTLAMEVVAQIFATFLGALILSLMLESPIHGLERALLGRYRNGDKSDKNADEENKQHTSNDQHNSEDQASSQL